LTYFPIVLKLIVGETKMPIYEYVCSDCDSKFEKLRPVSQCNEGAACPECQQEAGRILSTFACFSADESGMTSSVGGDSCSSCASDSCATCAM